MSYWFDSQDPPSFIALLLDYLILETLPVVLYLIRDICVLALLIARSTTYSVPALRPLIVAFHDILPVPSPRRSVIYLVYDDLPISCYISQFLIRKGLPFPHCVAQPFSLRQSLRCFATPLTFQSAVPSPFRTASLSHSVRETLISHSTSNSLRLVAPSPGLLVHRALAVVPSQFPISASFPYLAPSEGHLHRPAHSLHA